LKLLLDNNFSPRIARSLQALFVDEHEIVALREKFAASATDVEWISALHDERSWAVLSRDLRIRTRPHERAAMDRAAIVFFFLGGSWRRYSVEEQTWRLIRWIPKLHAQTSLADRGRFEVPINATSKLRPYRD
jgi:hypothetical protein